MEKKKIVKKENELDMERLCRAMKGALEIDNPDYTFTVTLKNESKEKKKS